MPNRHAKGRLSSTIFPEKTFKWFLVIAMGPFAKEAMFLLSDKSIVYWFGFVMKLPCFRNEIIDVGRDYVAFTVRCWRMFAVTCELFLNSGIPSIIAPARL